MSLLFVTLFMEKGGLRLLSFAEYRSYNLIPFDWIIHPYRMGLPSMAAQLLLNICITVPLGFFLPAVCPRFRKCRNTLLFFMIFIAVLETVQYFTGRSADIDDWIMNTAGAAAGYGVFSLFGFLFRDKTWWKHMITVN